MATHKVPQDVEAEDKLIGFLSLKQFIFTILGLGFGYLTFFFFTKVHPIAALIWIPPTIVTLVLGLYQRKDQPVEVFLASALRFYLKPHKRVWSLEGYEERVIVTVPPKVEHHYTKNFTGEEAVSRLTNLSHLMDSRGWTTKLTNDWQNPQLATAAAADRLVRPGQLQPAGINPQMYMQPVDVMDEQSSIVAQVFQNRLDQTESDTKQHMFKVMEQARQSTDNIDEAPQNNTPTLVPTYQKYPAIHQKIVSPDTSTESAMTLPAETTPAAPVQYVQEPVPRVSTPQPEERATDDGSVEIKLH